MFIRYMLWYVGIAWLGCWCDSVDSRCLLDLLLSSYFLTFVWEGIFLNSRGVIVVWSFVYCLVWSWYAIPAINHEVLLQMVLRCGVGLFVQEIADTGVWSISNMGWDSRIESALLQLRPHAFRARSCALGLWLSHMGNPHKVYQRLTLGDLEQACPGVALMSGSYCNMAWSIGAGTCLVGVLLLIASW